MRRLALILSLLWLVALSLSACENLNIHEPSESEVELESPSYFQAAPLDLKTPKSPDEMSADDYQANEKQRSLIAQNASAFARATLGADEQQTEANYVYSPVSTWLCYEMFLGGTSDSIQKDLKEALESQAMTDEAKLQAILQLSHDYQNAESAIQIQNALFVAEDSQFQAEYLNYAAHFLPALYTIDLEHHAHEVTEKINQLINEKTQGLIPRFYQDDLSPSLKSILMNITSLDASWLTEFQESETQDGDFHLEDGSSVQVPLMHQKISDDMLYAADEKAEYLRKPYQGPENMILILPREGESPQAALEHYLEQRESLDLDPYEVDITLPRFTIESSFDLKGLLSQIGLENLFDPAFAHEMAGLLEDKALFIDSSKQVAKIEVNEKGTRAAAVTDIATRESAAMPQETKEVTIRFDRPFAFLIMDGDLVLFQGVVTNPSK